MQTKLLNEELIKQIQEIFNNQLVHPVEIIYFFRNDSCESCEDAYQILQEIVLLSDKLHLSAYNINENPKLAQKYNVELVPGLVIVGREEDKLVDYGIRFFGIPSGYEFSSLIQGILLVSKQDSGLTPGIRNELKNLTSPVNLKVFVTPT